MARLIDAKLRSDQNAYVLINPKYNEIASLYEVISSVKIVGKNFHTKYPVHTLKVYTLHIGDILRAFKFNSYYTF